ncbi:MAG: tetratricopeptide repeat protein, partial [Planctomycetota bacterium]
MVSYLASMRNLKYRWFMVLILMCGVLCATLSAAPTSIDQAKRAKIDTTIRIIQEQIKRGLYPAAQMQLRTLQTSEEFSAYISEPQNQTITQLQAKVNRAIAEREQITRLLQQSDLLDSQGDYQEALKLLRQIKDSPFTTGQEKEMILASYQEVAGKVNQQQQKWQALYDSSVAAYNNGRMDEARQGLVQVIESGYRVKGAKTPAQYISMIDSGIAAQSTMPATEEMPVMEELSPMTTPQQGTQAQFSPVTVDVTIEPIELLELETNKQAADRASVQAQQGERSYLEVIKRETAVRVDYTRAIVTDAIEKAQQALDNQQFDQARQSLRRAFSTIEKNKMLLGDVYGEYNAQLTNLEQKVSEAQKAAAQQAKVEQQVAADQLTSEIRQTMQQQRERAVKDYMERAYAFQDEQRYEEALGQLEQLLAIDPRNQRALTLRQTLEHIVNFIEQRNIQSEIDRQEIASLLGVQRQSIPYSDEINYPRNWKEIAERREAALKKAETPADMAINELLDQTVDLSILTEDTTLEEAIGILQNSVSPPLPNVVVYWKDLADNGFIEKDTPINLSGEGLTSVVLRTALKSVLDAVSAGGYAELGYVVQQGTVTIATRDTLPTNYVTEIYDVTDLLNPPANYGNNGGGGGGRGGRGGRNNGGYSGGGGGYSGG